MPIDTQIEKFIYPADREGALFLSPDQVSIENGITRVLLNGEYYDRVIVSGIRAANAAIYPGGADQTAKLNAAFGKSIVKQIIFDEAGTNVYTISGTVTIPNDVIITIKGKNSFTGTGTINGGIWDVDDSHVLWASTLTVNPYSFFGGYVPPAAWGFLPDTGNDMTATFQKVVNWAVNAPIRKIYISLIGIYIINDLYILKTPYAANTGQASLTIEGVCASNGTTGGVKFYTNNPQAACYHTVQATGLYIRNISHRGAIPIFVSNPITQDWTNIGGVAIRSNGYTPHCVMNVDDLYVGFGSLMNSGNFYPGLDPALYSATQYTGSANVIFEDCVFTDFYVIIAEGLSGCPSGENIITTKCIANNFAYYWAAGQLQSRENVISNVFAFNFNTFITNIGFGTGIGDLPSVMNCNINNGKYLFQSQGDFTVVRFVTGYSEAMWSLGRSTSNNPVSFSNWNYTSLANDQSGAITPVSPVFVECKSFIWDGGKLEGINYQAMFPCNCLQAVFSGGVFIRGHVPFITNLPFFDKISFRDVLYTGDTGGEVLTEYSVNNSADIQVGTDESSYYRKFLLPGCKFTSRNHRTWENSGAKIDRLFIGVYAVTVEEPNHTILFTPNTTTVLRFGDMITIDENVDNSGDIYSATTTALGYVNEIGGGNVRLIYVPAGVVNGGVYSMYITRVPIFTGRHLGNVTNGSTQLTSVINDGHSFLSGDFIKGAGIVAGTRVVSTDYPNGIINISTPANVTGTGIEIYDIKTKVTADNAFYNYFGQTITVLSPNYIWYAGDEVMNVTGVEKVRSYYFIKSGLMNGSPSPIYFPVGVLVTETSQLSNDNGYVQANIIKLTGTPFESGPDPHPGDPTHKAPAAFDGDLSTYYESITSNVNPNNYLGLILDNKSVLTKIRIAPRDGVSVESFLIQGSNTSTSAGFVDLYTLPNVPFYVGLVTYLVPPTINSYKYLRIYQTNFFAMMIFELEFHGYHVDELDAIPTDGSTNAVQSNGVYDALALKALVANTVLTGTPDYADNAAAITGGLAVGRVYKTGDFLKVVH